MIDFVPAAPGWDDMCEAGRGRVLKCVIDDHHFGRKLLEIDSAVMMTCAQCASVRACASARIDGVSATATAHSRKVNDAAQNQTTTNSAAGGERWML